VWIIHVVCIKSWKNMFKTQKKHQSIEYNGNVCHVVHWKFKVDGSVWHVKSFHSFGHIKPKIWKFQNQKLIGSLHHIFRLCSVNTFCNFKENYFKLPSSIISSFNYFMYHQRYFSWWDCLRMKLALLCNVLSTEIKQNLL